MKQQIKVPSVGESVTQATIGEWQKKSGDYVRQNDVLVVMETDKASMDLVAEHSGQLNILKKEGEDVKVGEVIAELDTSVSPPSVEKEKSTQVSAQKTTSSSDSFAVPSSHSVTQKKQSFPSDKTLIDDLLKRDKAVTATQNEVPSGAASRSMNQTLSPAVRKLTVENKLDPAQIRGQGPGGRITKGDVLSFIKRGVSTNISPSTTSSSESTLNTTTRKRMSTIRKRIAERLVQSQQKHSNPHYFQRNRYVQSNKPACSIQRNLPKKT